MAANKKNHQALIVKSKNVKKSYFSHYNFSLGQRKSRKVGHCQNSLFILEWEKEVFVSFCYFNIWIRKKKKRRHFLTWAVLRHFFLARNSLRCSRSCCINKHSPNDFKHITRNKWYFLRLIKIFRHFLKCFLLLNSYSRIIASHLALYLKTLTSSSLSLSHSLCCSSEPSSNLWELFFSQTFAKVFVMRGEEWGGGCRKTALRDV